MDSPAQTTSDIEAIFEERRTSRRSFLRKAGLTLAIGLGGSLALARPAHAQNGHCCRTTSCASQLPGCPTGDQYLCTDCDGSTCCDCHHYGVTCQSIGCGLCGGASRAA
jgi:hypothetical protein